jgi:hypothetical protein
MYSNQQQRTHTPESVLPREEDVHALLLHHLWQVRRIAGTRAASITVRADTFDTSLGVRVKWTAYIDGVPSKGGEFEGAEVALKDLTERAAACTTAAQILALRAKADELERGIQ